jgi:hypothetical protein
MGHMTVKKTPCETGNRCKVPKWREELKPLRDDWIPDQYGGVTYEDLIDAVDGLCGHETHPDDWFEVPEAGYATAPYWRTQRAKARCYYQCPVRFQCLELALDIGEGHGIWGGHTADEREMIKTERANIFAKRAAAADQAAARQEEHDAETESET